MKTQFKRFSKSTISVLLAVCLLFSCMTVGLIATSAAQDDSESVGANISSGTTFYLDVTNFSGTYNSSYWLSLSGNRNTTATSSNTSGAGYYVPKSDSSWVEMTKVRGNIYSATTTAASSNGRVSFWSKSESGYDNVWEVNVSLGNLYDGTKNLFTISSGSSTHNDRRAVCFSGTWSVYDPANYHYECPASVLNGTDIMFYIQGYSGVNKLGNSSKTVSPGDFKQVDGSTTSYVKVAKSTAGNYQYITNNPGNWEGKQNTSIGSGSAGKLHVANDATSTTAAKTAATTLSSSSITTGTSSITLSTTCNSTTGVYNSLPLYYQYYLDDTYVASSEKSAKTTAQSFTLNTASLTAGTHTVETVLTDGNIFYIADTDTITVSAATPLTAPQITYGGSSATTQTMNAAKGSKATISWSAVSNADKYEVYKGSSKVATVSTTSYDIERGNSYGGAYTVKAVPASGDTSHSTSTASNSITFTFTKVTLPAPTVSGGNKTIASGTVTYSLSGGTGTLGTDYKYQHSGANNTSYSDVTGSTWTTGSMTNAGTYEYKFKTVAVATDYYSDSSVASDTITVRTAYQLRYYDNASATGTFSDDSSSTLAMTYDSTANAYYANVTVSNLTKFYYRIKTTNQSSNKLYAADWNGYPNVHDVDLGTTSSTGVTATTDVTSWGEKASLHYSGSSPKIIIWYNGTKTWITDNGTKHNVTITQPSTGGTIKVENATTSPQQFYEDDTVNYTVTANTGYVITSVTVDGTTTNVDRKSSYEGSFTLTADTAITATVARQYDITANSATGGTYTVKRGGTAVTKFIPGDSLTLTPSPNTHYNFTNFTISGGKTVTLTANPSTLDTTGATGNITITPTWTAKSYSYTTNAYYSTTGASDSYTNPLSAGVSPASGSATNPAGVTVTAPATVTVSGVKYNFVDFVATSGSVTTAATSGSNKTTTFKPTAANAVCTARYKKVYTITSSVDNTGTGAGTVSTNKTEVEAGGSYTITATAKSGSAIESVKVNGTAKTATASQTISSVSANQTVVAKFKSNVYLKGTMNATAWAGDVMTANTAGTSYTIANVVLNAGTTYEFKHWVDSGGDGTYSTAVGTWTLNNIATHSTKSDGFGGNNLTITPSVKAKVTFVSDGTKFTSITAVPYDSTKYTVTLKKVAGSTITGSYMGTDFTTASADATVQVYSGTAINFTVTADSDKYLTGITTSSGTLSPAFNATTHAATYTGAVTVTAATTITPAVAGKLKITSTTNKTALGTVSTSPEYARPGETVTITCTPAAGTIKTLVAYDTTHQTVVKSWERNASGEMKVKVAQASSNQFTQVGLSGIAGSIYSFIKEAGEALGAKDDSTAIGADDPLTFTMPNGAVTVTATYEEYVGTSEYIYHGRNTSGQAVSGYENEAMSEGMVNGQKYAYYNVTGRESVNYDQLFYISKGGSYEGRYAYFTAKGESYDDWYLPYGTNAHAYFFNSNGKVGTDFPGSTMTWVRNEGDNNKDSVWKIAIPSGATGVIFSNGKSGNSQKQTEDLSLTNVGAYYPSGYSNNKYTCSTWGSPPSDAGIIAGTNYYWGDADYSDHWYTGGFSKHNVNNDHNYAKPKDGNSQSFNECKDDYYIILLYPNTSYTFGLNGHDAETKTIGAKPMVLWSKELPGQSSVDVPTVKVYAKDGTIRRDGDKPERNDKTYSYFEQHANTYIYGDSGYANHIGVRSSHDGQSSEGSTGYNGYTYDYIAKFEKGETLYIQTNIDTSLRATHYLAAYCINGKTYALHAASESDDGVVTESFTVPEDWEDKYVEITPIYFRRDSAGTNTITFYIEGYDETVMNAGWGNTPFVYPFYQDANFNYVSNINNAFGGYPGQPMVFYKGNYYIQLPKEITTTISTGQTGTATIKGVTLGNGYWDDIHLITGEVSSHFQTYDYDDLYKIYSEYPNQADHIICSFKYRTKKNNDEPASMSSATAANYNKTNGNGWEVLTNYYGEPVDVFGNVLTGDAKTLAENIIAGTASAETSAVVHAISQDYKSNSAGDYATEWVIYNTSGTKVVATSGGKTSIVPSALAINANTSGSGELTANFDKYDNATKAFKSIYTALYNDTNVRNKPAVVTYEKSIYGGGDKADRCDARWYYSKKGQTITATTRIEYTDDGRTWNTDTYTSGTGTGSYTGAKAYFTGTAATATDTPTSAVSGKNTTTLDGTVGGGYYTFSAEGISGGTNGNYEFVGWYLLRDNYQNISSRSDYGAVSEFPSHAEMSKNGDIFVARFKKTATGTFDIYHEVHPQTTGYGNVSVSAVVKDSGGTQVASYPASGTTDHVTIPSNYIRSGEGYTVVATFTADPYNTSNFDAFYATVQDLLEGYKDYDFIDSISISATASGGTATVTYNVDKMFSMASGSPVQTVTNVTHYSKFSLKTDLTYSLEYTFNTRYYGPKLYKYTDVKFTEQELRSYFLNQITDPNCDHIKLDKQFVKAKAPFESNFREDLTWVVDNVTFNNDNDPTIGYLTATQVSKKWATAMVYDFDDNGEMRTTTMVAPIEKLFNESVNTKPTYQSDEAEAQDINAWSVDNDAMYHPLRTSYVPAGETSSAPLYIDHWDIYQLDSFTYKTVNNNPKMMDDGYNLDVDLSKSVLVAQAYSSRFNYVGYEDYVVVPVYNKDKVDRQGASDNRTDSSATLLTLTRNQWNANVAGNTQGGSYINSADRVYVDFMLNYNYSVNVNGKQTNILLNSTGDNIKVGFIVRSYTWENEQKQYGKAQYVLVDKDQINDKNRMEYCFGFNNSENNRKAGLYYEFKPFIVDTDNQGASAGCDVKIGNQTYKALYADSTVSVLDHVSFYQLGRL